MNTYVVYGAMVVQFCLILLLVSEQIRLRAAVWLRTGLRIFCLPAIASIWHTIIGATSGTIRLSGFLIVLSYFLFPALIADFLLHIGENRTKLRFFLNLVTIILMWIPVQIGLIQGAWAEASGIPTLGYPIAILFAVPFGMLIFNIQKDARLECRWALSLNNLRIICLAYIVLAAILIPIIISIRFAAFGINQPAWQWPLVFLFTFWTTGFVEELVFRAIIQNNFQKIMSPRAALVLTSVIFGLAHIHRKTGIYDFPNWPYVACATFAGLFYGYTYQKTRSLMSSSLVHTLIDATYRIFLRGAV